MHTIKLQVHDSIYSHIMFLLKNLDTKDLKIVEDRVMLPSETTEETSETQAFSNHSANLIEEWKDADEDNIWK